MKRLMLISVLLFSAGCMREPYKIVPVSGTVTLNGKPLPNAYIMFQPVNESGGSTQPPGSYGKTDAEGKYTLHVVGVDRDGAAVCKHVISVNAPEKLPPSNQEVAQRPKDRVPERYNASSTLFFLVPNEGTTAADFTLTAP
jgi:hypothetical protein